MVQVTPVLAPGRSAVSAEDTDAGEALVLVEAEAEDAGSYQ